MKTKPRLRGDHSTYTELAMIAANILVKCTEVTGVSPGKIITGKNSRGTRKIKIGDAEGCVLLTVRYGRSVQEVRVFTRNGQATKLHLAKELRNRDIPISFRTAADE